MGHPGAALLAGGVLLAGCAQGDPDWANRMAMTVGAPQPDAAMIRERQTTVFENVDERALLVETTQTLQDLGFTIEESVSRYGVLAGSKDRDAVETGEVAGQIALAVGLALLGANYQPTWDQDQVIRATVVTRPLEGNATRMRVSFERIVTRNTGQSRVEELEGPEFSRGFFEQVRAGLARGDT